MEVKKFEDTSFSSAMDRVKKEFGPDAVIITTEQMNGTTSITAARDYHVPERQSEKRTDTRTRQRTSRGVKGVVARNAYASPKHSGRAQISDVSGTEAPEGLMSLEELDNRVELDTLREDVCELKKEQRVRDTSFLKELALLRESLSSLLRDTVSSGGDTPLMHAPFLRVAVNAGIEQQVMRPVLNTVVDESAGEKALRDEDFVLSTLRSFFKERLRSADIIETMNEAGGEYVFAGPTGVGKTTTLVKAAATLVLERERDDIALVSVDFMRADGGSQLERFSKILGRPCFCFESWDEYSSGIDDIRGRYDILLTDTSGISPLNIPSLEFLEKVCVTDYTIPVLHIPVATEYDQALSIHDRFGEYIGDDPFLVFTKEDEALRNGLAASLGLSRGNRTGLVTDGQRIPEDLIRMDDAGTTLVDCIFRRKV